MLEELLLNQLLLLDIDLLMLFVVLLLILLLLLLTVGVSKALAILSGSSTAKTLVLHRVLELGLTGLPLLNVGNASVVVISAVIGIIG